GLQPGKDGIPAKPCGWHFISFVMYTKLLTGMKRPAIWIPIVAVVVGSCIVACNGSREEIIQPQFKKLTSAVYASGALLPEDEYTVMCAVDGYLYESYVQEGDTVKKGQSLF